MARRPAAWQIGVGTTPAPFVTSAAAAAEQAAAAWRAAVIANGGTVSAARLQTVQSFIAAEMAAGPWALTDDYFPPWGENASQALTSLKQRRLGTLTGAPTFTADRGYTFNGTTQYLDTGFIPATHAIAMTNGNGRAAMYERLDVSSNNTAAGCQSGTGVAILLNPRSTATARNRMLEADLITPTLPVATALGYMSVSRAGTATVKTWKNGIALADGTGITLGATLPTAAFWIGCYNTSGVGGAFRQTAPGLLCLGAPLSDAQEAAQYANVQAWATAIGANV